MNTNPEDSPFVSVIVPVYNDPDGIRRCLESLTAQTYPEDRYEVIVVDNNSTDDTSEVIRKFPVQLLFETEIQSSYAARNTGIKEATGEIVAFTDADGIPNSSWIEDGVRALQKRAADIAAGRIKMFYPEGKSAGERYNAKRSMRNDECEQKGAAVTANLFVRRQIFDEFQQFPESLISGGDFYWTSSAVDEGYKLVYANDAIVEHAARNLTGVLKKKVRVGKGNVQMWRLEGKHPVGVIIRKVLDLPAAILSRSTAVQSDAETETNRPSDRQFKTGKLFIVIHILATLAQNYGRFYEILFGDAR